ncbi:MAG TPA: hypothetical protein VNW53_04305 [Phenylobacterium sp.]|jgi:hypothetical protein|uniref:hypothetical protein n=1 Tax=Phenylobacterium sp. TaxID=1871053 RepID=UPI002C917427|nr:hypothetical protein [Phenylobacterium sp.]HXA38199.1 hypothetical protein [Phenylobacterium sp.]
MRGAAILGVGLLCAGCGQVADAQARLIDSLRIRDAVAGYQKAANPLDRCVKAKAVAIAYSDARDGPETQAWSAREHEDCQAALTAMHAALPAKP